MSTEGITVAFALRIWQLPERVIEEEIRHEDGRTTIISAQWFYHGVDDPRPFGLPAGRKTMVLLVREIFDTELQPKFVVQWGSYDRDARFYRWVSEPFDSAVGWVLAHRYFPDQLMEEIL